MHPSATTKAFKQMEFGGNKAEIWMRGSKDEAWMRATASTSASIQKRIINHNLSKIIRPKNALALLQDLKPGCRFRIMEDTRKSFTVFVAYVEYYNDIIATGEGLSKKEAKCVAAENVIKNIVNETMNNYSSNEILGSEDVRSKLNPMSNLPWAELASLAIYKMFSQWKNEGEQGMDKYVNPVKKTNEKKEKKQLPPNAHQIHPSILLNTMMPNLTAVELGQEEGPQKSFKMGYNIDGIMYTGNGHSKKEAKKEAAKAVLFKFYGVIYDPL